VNLQITMHANRFTKKIWLVYAVVLFALLATTANAWDIDLSRRRKAVTATENTPTSKNAEPALFESILPAGQSSQELVILSTEQGFIPRTVRVKKDQTYTMYVVNVNEKEKNVSFILDAFSEHHGTYYGKIQKFEITPKKEGVYSFHCPETSQEGKVVVFTGEVSRQISSQKED
jgi:hypothetical protein